MAFVRYNIIIFGTLILMIIERWFDMLKPLLVSYNPGMKVLQIILVLRVARAYLMKYTNWYYIDTPSP